jgi:hypothetical protein
MLMREGGWAQMQVCKDDANTQMFSVNLAPSHYNEAGNPAQ